MKDNNNNQKKALIGLGLLMVGGQGALMYRQSGKMDKIGEQLELATSESTKIKTDLEKNRASNDSIVSINSGLTESLILDDKKIKSLTSELNIAKNKLHKLQLAYNSLKAKSENLAENLRETRVSAPSNSNAGSDLARRREELRAKKDSIARARMEAIAARRIQEEQNRLNAIAARKADAERQMADKQAAERNKFDALAANKAEKERLLAEKLAAENSKIEALAAARRAEADRAERARLEALAAQKSTQVVEKPVVVAKQQTQQERIQAMLDKKKSDLARAQKTISDKNDADRLAIENRAKGIETGTNKVTPSNNTTAEDVDKRATTPSKSITNQNPQVADKLTKIKITSVNASTFRYVDPETKEEEETDDSSEVGFIKVGFTIPQNFVVRASDRNYYIQVLDEQNNLVGDNATEVVDGEKVTYCYRTNIKYKNRAYKFSDNIFIKGLKEGTYTVKILDRKDVVSQTKIVLN